MRYPKENKIEAKEINRNIQNVISNNQKIIKKRNAGVDLLRIISMIAVIYVNIISQGKGIDKYNEYKNKINKSKTYAFFHSNAYGVISGIVGYKSTRYSNLLYLWLCVVFYSVGIHYYYLKYKRDTYIGIELYK